LLLVKYINGDLISVIFSMMETEIPVVVEEVKEMLVPHIIVIKPLAEGKNKSAQDLLKLLADSKKVEQKSLVKEERPKRGKK